MTRTKSCYRSRFSHPKERPPAATSPWPSHATWYRRGRAWRPSTPHTPARSHSTQRGSWPGCCGRWARDQPLDLNRVVLARDYDERVVACDDKTRDRTAHRRDRVHYFHVFERPSYDRSIQRCYSWDKIFQSMSSQMFILSKFYSYLRREWRRLEI